MALSQTNRLLQVTTPLGEQPLVVTGFRGTETISRLFSFNLNLIAENSTTVDFDRLIGNPITLAITTPGNGGSTEWRYVNGICAAFSQGDRNQEFSSYFAEVVPKIWLLTHVAQSRVFQQLSVPDILKQVFQGYDCDYQLRGQYDPREYCVQYRETDFSFASRLMEDEGIYYFFVHSDGAHKMIIADTPQSHTDVPGLPQARYQMIEGGPRTGDHVWQWTKTQTIRASKYTLWDHHFQQPTQNLEAKQNILPSVQVGAVTHNLKDAVNSPLEIYDFPGGYAERHDGISPSGGEQPQRLQQLFEDNQRTVKLRMEAEAVRSLEIQGISTCANFVAGHKFSLERHFDAQGEYVLVSVVHEGSLGRPYRSGQGDAGLTYTNNFSCIPIQLPYRPQRETPVPFIAGVQNALVVGPAGKEIFIDKYGRVKVQFYWDRLGQKNENSSCWLRVGQSFAGKRWGASFWPRLGQEVLVAFVEGDPDQPVIVGSVYNAEQMPAYEGDGLDPKHQNDPNVSGVKTNSTLGGSGFNEIRFDDTKGNEELFFHAERDLDITTKNDSLAATYGNRHQIIGTNQDGQKSGSQFEEVYQDKNLTVNRNQIEQVGDSMQLLIGGIDSGQGHQDVVIKGTRKQSVGQDDNLQITGDRKEKVDGSQSLTVGMGRQEKVGMNHALEAGMAINLKGGMTVTIEGMELILKGAGGAISIGPTGVTIQGPLTMIEVPPIAALAGALGGSDPSPPDSPSQANPTKPTLADDSKSGQKSVRS
jgi:type VI secretion system secreted protein VgrG